MASRADGEWLATAWPFLSKTRAIQSKIADRDQAPHQFARGISSRNVLAGIPSLTSFHLHAPRRVRWMTQAECVSCR